MKKLLLTTFLIPSFAMASPELTRSPYPDAKDGINVWPIEKVNGPGASHKFKRIASKGFEESTESDQTVHELLEIQKNGTKETAQYDKISDPLDTHLRSKVSSWKFSFNFSGIPGITKENIFGFSPAGGYTKEKGWDGVVEFVKIPEIGICSFTTMKIEKVILFKEDLLFDVNGKHTNKSIMGNYNTGFIYTVDWYTNNRSYHFECANKDLKRQNLNKMISIANQIDKSIS